MRRQAAINRGAIAETTLRDLESTFEDVERILIEQFIKNSKQLGDLDRAIGYEIIGLADVKTRLTEHIEAGHKAAKARQKEITEQLKDAGGSEI